MNFRILPLSLLVLALPWSASANVIWSPATLSDNNGGAFLTSAVTNAGGDVFTLTLPNFTQSDFAGFPGEVDLGVSASWTTEDYSWAIFRYIGTFQNPGSADYAHSAGAASSGASGNTLGTFTEVLFFGAGTSVDLLASAILNDAGGLAAVSQIDIRLVKPAEVPEPASFLLFGTGIGLLTLLGAARKSRR